MVKFTWKMQNMLKLLYLFRFLGYIPIKVMQTPLLIRFLWMMGSVLYGMEKIVSPLPSQNWRGGVGGVCISLIGTAEFSLLLFSIFLIIVKNSFFIFYLYLIFAITNPLIIQTGKGKRFVSIIKKIILDNTSCKFKAFIGGSSSESN